MNLFVGSVKSINEGSHLRADVLLWSPRVIYIDNFLSEFECDFIIGFAKNNSGKRGLADNYASVYFPDYPKLPLILQDIERRIGTVTGSPPHPGEESLNIHKIPKYTNPIDYTYGEIARLCLNNTVSPATAETCSFAVKGVHHDKVQKEYSSSTVIVYLNDVDVGGGTVFPCMMNYDFEVMKQYDEMKATYSGARIKGFKQPSHYCNEAFELNGRWFDGKEAVEFENFKKHTPIDSLRRSLQEIIIAAHFGCIDNVNNSNSNNISDIKWIHTKAVRTVAKKGAAVVFFHDAQDGNPETQVWHAGCAPISHDKWTMQKFKELPQKFRKPIWYGKNKEHINKGNEL